MIEPMKPKQPLKAAEIQDGDIICFQVAENRSSLEFRFSESSSISSMSLSHLTQQLTVADDDRRTPSVSSNPDRIEDARLYYDFLTHRKIIRVYPHPIRNANPAQYKPFDLTLSSKATYDQLAARIGDNYGVQGSHLRLWTVNATTGQPKTSVKRGPSQTLGTILNPPYNTFSNNNQRADSLYFEALEISLSELDTKKNIKVLWISEGITKEVRTYPIHDV